jgi:hypothetical protein
MTALYLLAAVLLVLGSGIALYVALRFPEEKDGRVRAGRRPCGR